MSAVTQISRIVFILDDVANMQSIVDVASRQGDPVFVLNSRESALAQIKDIVASKTGIDEMHVISHGSEGKLYLGNVALGAGNIDSYQTELSAIGASLTSTGDLLFYGCNAAAGTSGKALVEMLAKLTKADVAASGNATGASTLGGDWILESQQGEIEAAPLIVAYYDALLARPVEGTTDFTAADGKSYSPSNDKITASSLLGWDFTLQLNATHDGGQSIYVEKLGASKTETVNGYGSETIPISYMSVKSNDDSSFKLNSIDVVLSGFDNKNKGGKLQLVGYSKGSAVQGASMTMEVGDILQNDGKVVTFAVYQNDAFAGIDSFRISATDGKKVTGMIGIGAINAKNFGVQPVLTAPTITLPSTVQLLKDIMEGSAGSGLIAPTRLGDKLFFLANDGKNGIELWVSDGTADGTTLFKNIAAGNTNSMPTNLTVVGDKLFFSASNGINGVELWVSDGTEAGTRLVKDINSGTASSDARGFTVLGDKLFFSANDGKNGIELWVSDGTADGTKLVKDIDGSPGDGYPTYLAALGNKLFFRGNDGKKGAELWVSDGTESGTTLVKDIVAGNKGSALSYLKVVGNKLFFSANDDQNGFELWVSDGTDNGTRLVKDIRSGSASSEPTYFTALGDKLFFTANDGQNGKELWVSDGTADGTRLIKDIRSGSDGSQPSDLIALGDKLFFTADDGQNGKELWVSDGTETGTRLVKDINSGPDSSNISNLSVQGDKLFFSANDHQHGNELWVSDGTESGTHLIKDINRGNQSSHPGYFNTLGDKLLFAANNGQDGSELWFYQPGTIAQQGQTVLFSAANNNAISVNYADANAELTVTLTTTKDAATLKANGNNVSGNGSHQLTLTGKLVDIQAALAEVSYQPAAKTVGKQTLTVTVNVGGQNTSSTLPIEITAATPVAIKEASYDAASGKLTATLNQTANGTVDLAKLALGTGTFSDSNSFKLSGSATINGNSFSHTLSGVDKMTVNGLLNKNGSSNHSNASYQLQAEAGWLNDAEADMNTAITASKVVAPGITAIKYHANSGVLTITGSNLVKTPGAANDLDLSKLTFSAGEGNQGPFMTSGTGFEIDGDSITITLDEASKTKLAGLKSGSGSAYETNVQKEWNGIASPELGFVRNVLTVESDPKVLSVSANSSNGNYKTGDKIAVTVKFDEVVKVTGKPTLELNTGNTADKANKLASYKGGDGTDTLTFEYTVQDGDKATDLDYATTTALVLNDGSIADAAGNAANLALPAPGTEGSLGKGKDIQLNAPAATITLPSMVQLLKDIQDGPKDSSPSQLTRLGDKLFFRADDGKNGPELWVSDGTKGGTKLVKDIATGTATSWPAGFTALGDKLFFSASDGKSGGELWVSDGTADGTKLVKDINEGGENSAPNGFTAVGDKLFFSASDGKNGVELWVSDGTEAGTRLVKDINKGQLYSSPTSFAAVGNKVFFRANDSDNGSELWVSDGTEAGTKLVKDIQVGGQYKHGYPEYLTVLGDKLFFTAIDSDFNRELWVSDGTEAGTRLVKDIQSGINGSSPYNLTVLGDKLFFQADDGKNGRELWVSDGTEAGTHIVKDINIGKADGSPLNFTVLGDKIFFTADDGKNGKELWVSDGTEAGTRLVKDIQSGPKGSNPYNHTVVGDKLLFGADDGKNGTELWVSDGTEAGTRLVGDINITGSGNSAPSNLKAVGDKLFFSANDGKNGAELWAYQLGAMTQQGKTLVFAAANHNAISVNYTDANAELTVTLTTTKDAATLKANGTQVSGNGSHQLTLTGKLADIQTALAEVSYQPAANTVGKQTLTVTVNVGGQNTSSTLPIEITEAPASKPTPTPTPPPAPVTDKDGVPDTIENKVPVLLPVGGGKAVEGDGNGDGIADSVQSNVSSVGFLNTTTAQSNPGDAKQVYVTLVSDSSSGKTGATATAALSDVKQLDKPADAPADLSMPLGLIAFKADAGSAGASKNFSLYVDSSVSVNGYWKKVGNDWVNLASQEFGGKVVTEGGKTRLDFTIVDGGKFDSDGKKDGVITDPGAIGFRAGSSSDSDNDQFPDALEAANGLKVGIKDNDVFSSSKFFVMQLYRDVLSREAESEGLAVWQKQLDSGLMNRAQITHAFMNSAEFQSEAGAISRLNLGALGKQAEKAELDSQVELLRSGKNLSQLASDFFARSDVASQFAGKDNAAFVGQLYTQVLGRQGEAAGVQAWKGLLDGGMARSQVLLGFTESAEFKALSDQRVKLGMDYLYLLERTPDAAGYANWLGMTQQWSAVEIIGHFINSPEYHGRFLP